MTLLQLPNGDITICSATLLRISQHFQRVLWKEKKKKNLSVPASLNAIEFDLIISYSLFQFFLVLRVSDKCPERWGGAG